MNTRQTIRDIQFGACGRVVYPRAELAGIVRANDTSIWPETTITVVIIV